MDPEAKIWEKVMRYPHRESSVLELKRQLPRNDQIVKTIIGFCNQKGGKLVIGVGDDLKVIGVPESKIEECLESVDKAIHQATAPPILPRVYSQHLGNKWVVIVEVSEGMQKPYYRRAEGRIKGSYIRLGRNTVRVSEELAKELAWQARGIDFEVLPVHSAHRDDLDLDAIRQFLSHRKNHGRPSVTDQILAAYRLEVSEHARRYPSHAGILLFGHDPQAFLSEAMIICTQFSGTKGRKVIGSLDCERDLFHQFDQAYEFVAKRLSRSFRITGKRRKEKLEIPPEALREALLNAIVHRNYHLKSPTKVAMYDDRIEIFSPGEFPGPIDAENLRNGISYLRNPALYKVLREAGYVEKLGLGLITILDSYAERGLPEPQIFEGTGFVKCILPRPSSTAPTASRKDPILQVIHRFGEASVQELMQELRISRSTVGRRLTALVDAGQIERIGKGRATRYHLS